MVKSAFIDFVDFETWIVERRKNRFYKWTTTYII
jgi:hypothetical protein